MTFRTIAGTVACAITCALAPAVAQANDTISYSGGTLIYAGDGDAAVDVIASAGNTDGYIHFYEYTDGQGITGPGDKCMPAGDGLDCQIPSAMRASSSRASPGWPRCARAA